mgnify:CR=1 FL=1
MKKIKILIAIFLVGVLNFSCSGDDDGGGMDNLSVVGTWEVLSGTNFENAVNFVFKSDNTFAILYQDELGFRDVQSGNYSDNTDSSQLTMQFFIATLVNYNLEGDQLNLNFSDGETVTLRRTQDNPEANWITNLTILQEGNAPWTEDSDIAWNGTHILLGNGYEVEDIGLINPETLELDDVITTTESAFAVEVEKSNFADRYIFKSDNGFSKYMFYTEDTETYVGESTDLGPWINGIASVGNSDVWVSSGNNNALYLHDYASDLIEKTIDLGDRSADGLDYQDGFLYVCSQGNLYKCDVSGSDIIITDTYGLPGYVINGVAFDGSNFWVNAIQGNQGKLIKINLSI